MNTALMAAPRIAAIDLNQPSTYLHWSIFNVSVANLVLIAVMVVIFGAALLLPFPGRHRTEPAETAAGAAPEEAAAAYLGDPADAKMWTARVRRWGCARCRRTSCCLTGSPPTSRPGCMCSG